MLDIVMATSLYLVIFLIYLFIGWLIMMIVNLIVVKKITLFVPPFLIGLLCFILFRVGNQKYQEHIEELASYGYTPGNFSMADETFFFIILLPLIVTTLIWSIVYFIKRYTRVKVNLKD
ncbi:hypothetical protein [Alkalicoccobacillus porphyridii]|uniref:Uncharacterized protein n=1 Tax=Alkalicoccobacillus porphyridii TaxID=2597270 RepID=A0A553ZYU8_9BACI|nr:hypothetical protein [Alkalicoccobacillus porphyridii]TSB46621.1 hypothetical protein FN960_09705 [Alkalicoccobacillus porphyridii]